MDYERSISRTAKENPKKFWEFVKSKTKVKDSIPDLEIPGTDGPNTNPEMTSTDKEKADVLSKFFSSVFIKDESEPVPNFEKRTNNILQNLIITEEMVLKKLQNLKTFFWYEKNRVNSNASKSKVQI